MYDCTICKAAVQPRDEFVDDYGQVYHQRCYETNEIVDREQKLIAALLPIARAYPDDPGVSDLYDEQPVSITLGDVRRARMALYGAGLTGHEWNKQR